MHLLKLRFFEIKIHALFTISIYTGYQKIVHNIYIQGTLNLTCSQSKYYMLYNTIIIDLTNKSQFISFT
jgi:hypothetical protein